MSGHIYSPLMKSVINDLFVEGFPGDEEICLLDNQQKRELYEKQKVLIHEFRMRADMELKQMENLLKSIPKEEQNEPEINVKNDPKSKSPKKVSLPQQEIRNRSPRLPMHESRSQPIRINRRLLQNPALNSKRTESRIRNKQVLYNGKPPFRR